MAWTAPKTDWNENDYINVIDYNRWLNNLKFLQDLCQTMYPYTQTTLGNDQTESDFPYADMLNDLETALDEINDASYDLDIGEAETFSANSFYIAYNECNRIESAMLKLYNWLNSQAENVPKLAFTLGDYRGIRI